MKKFAKMSLVAAVAVAGLSSTVSAKDLAESIKGVDFSGSVTYRYDETKYDDAASAATKANEASNSFSIVTHTKAKINDDAALNVEVDVWSTSTTSTASTGGDVTVREIYFDYTAIKNTTIKLGKQAVDTPWTDAYDYITAPVGGSQQSGDGIVASVKAGPATLAAAYFLDTDFAAASDVAVVAAIVPAGPVNLQAWFIDVNETSNGAKDGRDGYYFEAATKLEGWSLMASYTALETDVDVKDNMLKLTAKGKIGPVGVKAGYGKNSKKDGSGVTAYDVDAKSQFLVWSVNSKEKAGFKGYYVGADMNVIPSTNIALVYADSDAVNGFEFSELIGQVSYKMSKNFSTYLRYAIQEEKASSTDTAQDRNRGRVQIKYDF